MNEDVPAPAILNGLAGVPFALRWRFDGVEEAHVMPPRQLGNDPLHNCLLRPSIGSAKICSQSVDDFRPPPFRLLAREDGPPDAPIQKNQFPVDG